MRRVVMVLRGRWLAAAVLQMKRQSRCLGRRGRFLFGQEFGTLSGRTCQVGITWYEGASWVGRQKKNGRREQRATWLGQKRAAVSRACFTTRADGGAIRYLPGFKKGQCRGEGKVKSYRLRWAVR